MLGFLMFYKSYTSIAVFHKSSLIEYESWCIRIEFTILIHVTPRLSVKWVLISLALKICFVINWRNLFGWIFERVQFTKYQKFPISWRCWLLSLLSRKLDFKSTSRLKLHPKYQLMSLERISFTRHSYW